MSHETVPSSGLATGRPVKTPVRQATRWALRVTAVLQLAAIVTQGVTAGGMMSGALAGGLHGSGSTFVHVSGLLQLIAAILFWRPGRGPGWPTWLSLALLLGGFVQSAMGGSGVLLVHVPLAIGLTAATTWLVVWSWSRRTADGDPP